MDSTFVVYQAIGDEVKKAGSGPLDHLVMFMSSFAEGSNTHDSLLVFIKEFGNAESIPGLLEILDKINTEISDDLIQFVIQTTSSNINVFDSSGIPSSVLLVTDEIIDANLVAKIIRRMQFRTDPVAEQQETEPGSAVHELDYLHGLIESRIRTLKCHWFIYDATGDQFIAQDGTSTKPSVGDFGWCARVGDSIIVKTLTSNALETDSFDILLPVNDGDHLFGLWKIEAVLLDNWQYSRGFIDLLVQLSVPAMAAVLPEVKRRARGVQSELLLNNQSMGLFRDAAVQRHYEADTMPEPLRFFSPIEWSGVAIVCLGLLLFVTVIVFGKVVETASGVGFVVSKDEEALVAHKSGIVADVLVKNGDVMVEGHPIIRIANAEDLTELRAIKRRHKQLLATRLMSIYDATADSGMKVSLDRLDILLEKVDRGTLVAPRRGVVGAINLKVGDFVRAGQQIATIQPVDAKPIVRVAVSADHMPYVHPGKRVIFRYPDYNEELIWLVVFKVWPNPVVPSEMQRLFPISDERELFDRPSVVLEATLEDSNRHAALIFGMTGEVELPIRERRLISFLSNGT